jgi:uncharacterized coiled-coil protein SlyX
MPTQPIHFRADALVASHEDIVNNISNRLDELQSKIAGAPEVAAESSGVRTVSSSASKVVSNNNDQLHARVSTLESIHEDTLSRLNTKLESLERSVSSNKDSERLMGNIVDKFTQIEARLRETSDLRDRMEKTVSNNKDAEHLMGSISSKLTVLESRLKQASELSDRVAKLESKSQTHHQRVTSLEAKLEPDPEHTKILSRINAKLDLLEKQKSIDNKDSRASLDLNRDSLGGKMVDSNKGQIDALQDRIRKLQELRSKYELQG